MILKKLKDPFLILSVLFLVGALVFGGLLVQYLSAVVQRDDLTSNIHLTEEDEDFVYLLPLHATDFQVELFERLTLEKSIFEESPDRGSKTELAALVVQNFIADFFTWSNKEGRWDVGGLQFIASEVRSNFRDAAIDGFYLYLNQYIELFGREGLIQVDQVWIRSVDLDYTLPTFEIKVNEIDQTEEEVESYLPVIRVEAEWAYVGGFHDFQNTAVFYLTHEGGYLSIRAMLVEDIYEEEDNYA